MSRTSAFRAARVSERSEDERETPWSADAPRWGAASDAANAGRTHTRRQIVDYLTTLDASAIVLQRHACRPPPA